MPHYNVKRPDGMWAMFSTVVDDYLKPFTSKEEHEKWRLEKYGSLDYRPAEECNMMEYEEAERRKSRR